MKVTVKERYKNELNTTVCASVLKKLNIYSNFEIEYVKGNGRYILVEHEDKRYYVIVSREIADSRDAFVNQYISIVLSEYIKDPFPNKELFIYLLDVSARAKTKYILDGLRMAKTIDINILNEDELHLNLSPYVSFEDWKNSQEKMREYNSANNSSYAIENDDDEGYTLYGKLYGANGKDSAFTACQLAQIAKRNNKKLHFVQVCEHGTDKVSPTDRELLTHFGVDLSAGAIVLENRKINNKSTCRKQDEFKYNLLEKYGNKRCYLCDCDIEANIIASHIHRITDIDNSGLTDAEKRKQAVDGNNGLWLCANHDKMFEHGILTFNKTGDLVISEHLSKSQIAYVRQITKVLKINDSHLTKELIAYLMLHNKRVNLGL